MNVIQVWPEGHSHPIRLNLEHLISIEQFFSEEGKEQVTLTFSNNRSYRLDVPYAEFYDIFVPH